MLSLWFLVDMIESADSYNCSYFPHLFICVCVKVMHLDISKFKISGKIYLKTFLVPLSLVHVSPAPEAASIVSFCVYFHDTLYTASKFIFVFSLKEVLYPLTSVDSYSDLCLQLGEKKSIVYKCLGLEPDC